MCNWSNVTPDIRVSIHGDAILQIAKVRNVWGWSLTRDNVYREGTAPSVEMAKSILVRELRNI